MTDRRELLLDRLLTLLTALDGVEGAFRNLEEISEAPSQGSAYAILFDGDEQATENTAATGAVGNVIYMTPEVVITLAEVPETVGTSTNAWRLKVVKAILNDATLKTLSGGIRRPGARYVGCSSSLHPGRATQVMLTMHFTIGYALDMSEL